jgi:hypothetical protein
MPEKWKIDGTYFEACNCDIACPCTFLSAPTEGECKAVVGWHIDNGNIENISLSGLNVALVIYSPGPMLQEKWRVALYIDNTASEEQKDALTKIYTGQIGGHLANLTPFIGEVLGIKSVPIEYEAKGKRRKLKVADLGEAEIEALPVEGGGDVLITNAPLGVAPGTPLVVAKSEKVKYKDYGLEWELSGKNGFYASFTYSGN